MTAAQAPVFSPRATKYTSFTPSRLLAALSCSARSSSPTEPVKTTEFGGRMYYKQFISIYYHVRNVCIYRGSSSGVLSRAACHKRYIVVLCHLIVSSNGAPNQLGVSTIGQSFTNISSCLSFARIPSFALRWYFSKSFSPSVTSISRSGWPMQNRGYIGLDIANRESGSTGIRTDNKISPEILKGSESGDEKEDCRLGWLT